MTQRCRTHRDRGPDHGSSLRAAPPALDRLAVLLAWVLVPIYLVALGAFGGRLGVFRWPKIDLADRSVACSR